MEPIRQQISRFWVPRHGFKEGNEDTAPENRFPRFHALSAMLGEGGGQRVTLLKSMVHISVSVALIAQFKHCDA